jgi:predicted restriction endonuclease
MKLQTKIEAKENRLLEMAQEYAKIKKELQKLYAAKKGEEKIDAELTKRFSSTENKKETEPDISSTENKKEQLEEKQTDKVETKDMNQIEKGNAMQTDKGTISPDTELSSSSAENNEKNNSG